MKIIFMQLQVTEGIAAGSSFLGSGNVNNDILTAALVVVMAVVLVAAIVVLRAMRMMVRVMMPQVLES